MEMIFVDKGDSIDEYTGERERRKHVRFPVRLALKYADSLPEEHSDFVLNLSEGGVFIETQQPLPPGSEVVMHFYIPPESMLLGEFSGCVKWVNTQDNSKPFGMGIVFTHCTEEAKQRLIQYLEETAHLVDQTA